MLPVDFRFTGAAPISFIPEETIPYTSINSSLHKNKATAFNIHFFL